MVKPVLPTRIDGYVGPPVKTIGTREKYLHQLSRTCSVSDPLFPVNVKTIKVAKPIFDALKDPIRRVEAHQHVIEDALERRVSIFIQQLVAVYGTRLHFKVGTTSAQPQSAGAITLESPSGKKATYKRDAAHSSTIPVLWASKQVGGDQFVFMKESQAHTLSNSGISCAKEINEADREIDEKYKAHSLLRDKAIAILNRASNGDITLEEGVTLFLDAALLITNERRLNAKEPAVRRVLDFYSDHFAYIRDGVVFDAAFFDEHLNVRIDPDDRASTTRRTIYHLRFKAIQDAHLAQSKLVARVKKVKAEVMGVVTRKPTYFDDAFYYTLVAQMSTPLDRKAVIKMFNLPGEGIGIWRSQDPAVKIDKASTRKATYLGTKKRKVTPHVAKIKALATELKLEMRHLRTEEILKRGAVLRVVRNERGWQQWRLGNKIKAAFPHAPASQSTISRSETGVRIVDKDYARKLAYVLKVDPGLFMTQSFYA